MPLIAWIASYRINVAEIDAQHKGLADLINRLHDSMGQGAGVKVIGEVMDALVAYTQTHFTTEEKLMIRFQYPDYEAHKLEHDKLVKWVARMQKGVESGKNQVTIEVMKTLKDWFLNHTQGTDRALGPFLNSRGVF